MNSKIFKWAGLKKKLVMVAILSFSLGMSMTSCTDWLEMEYKGVTEDLYTRRCFIILVWVKR